MLGHCAVACIDGCSSPNSRAWRQASSWRFAGSISISSSFRYACARQRQERRCARIPSLGTRSLIGAGKASSDRSAGGLLAGVRAVAGSRAALAL